MPYKNDREEESQRILTDKEMKMMAPITLVLLMIIVIFFFYCAIITEGWKRAWFVVAIACLSNPIRNTIINIRKHWSKK